MNFWDYLLIGLILLAVLGALRLTLKNRRQGKSCGGNCAHCDRKCGN